MLVDYLTPIVANLDNTEILTTFNAYLSSFPDPFHLPMMSEIAANLTRALKQSKQLIFNREAIIAILHISRHLNQSHKEALVKEGLLEKCLQMVK